MWDTLHWELQTMLNLKVVEESHSLWWSPIVLVPKMNGTVWFCINFRKVNAKCAFDTYLRPQVNELMEQLGAV